GTAPDSAATEVRSPHPHSAEARGVLRRRRDLLDLCTELLARGRKAIELRLHALHRLRASGTRLRISLEAHRPIRAGPARGTREAWSVAHRRLHRIEVGLVGLSELRVQRLNLRPLRLAQIRTGAPARRIRRHPM